MVKYDHVVMYNVMFRKLIGFVYCSHIDVYIYQLVLEFYVSMSNLSNCMVGCFL